MILRKISIENFRSIKELEVDIKEIGSKQALFFFGVNETGKSNILKAISLLRKDGKVQYDKDCEKQAYKFSQPISISYFFEVSKAEAADLIKEVAVPESLKSKLIISTIQKTASFDKSPKREEKLVFHFDKGIPLEQYSYIKETDKVVENPKEENSELKEGAKDELTTELLSSFLENKIGKPINKMLPEIIFWEPSPKYLINAPINLEQFKQDQNISIPLHNIFKLIKLSGSDLVQNIERMIKNSEERSELEETLSEEITKHINTLWPEHKINIRVRIEANNLCTVSIEDKDNTRPKFSMDQRSDGFKQFLSILLTLSVENKTEQLSNKVILLDEPERSLHPSSTKYLKDELLNIAKNNVVMVASHSIYMVDKKHLDRHFTVKKEKGLTYIERIDPENPFQEEVIYESLGTSVYEIIEPNVIIFEGKTDKDLFDLFTQKLKTKINPSRIKTMSASGANQVPKYIKFFDQKLVNGFVVVDSDKQGLAVRDEIIKENANFKNRVFELKELVTTKVDKITIEDLLPVDFVLACANEHFSHTFPPPTDSAIIKHIKKIKDQNGLTNDQKLEEFKNSLVKRTIKKITKAKISEVEESFPLFSEFVKSVHQKVKG